MSPDERRWASGSYDRAVLIWDAASGSTTGELRGHGGLVNAVAWSPDGARIASASSDHSARIWDPASGAEQARLLGHTDDVNDVRFSPDGTRVATASFDGSVRLWDLEGRTLLIAGHHGSDVNGVAWFPDGRRLAAASDDGSVSVFDADGGRVRRILDGHGRWGDQVAIDPSGKYLYSAGQGSGKLAAYRIEASGKLSPIATYEVGPGPAWVHVQQLGQGSASRALERMDAKGRERVRRSGHLRHRTRLRRVVTSPASAEFGPTTVLQEASAHSPGPKPHQ